MRQRSFQILIPRKGTPSVTGATIVASSFKDRLRFAASHAPTASFTRHASSFVLKKNSMSSMYLMYLFPQWRSSTQ